MSKKEVESQIKKTGKTADNFICLADPEDVFTWYFLIFNFDYMEYSDGFYLGKVVCSPEYPAIAPKIQMLTENGRFTTTDQGIHLPISNYNPESWKPDWRV